MALEIFTERSNAQGSVSGSRKRQFKEGFLKKKAPS
jgi:hypothetical protein